MDKERIDEALEVLWVLDEAGQRDMERFQVSSDDPDFEEMKKMLEKEDLIVIDGPVVRFTEKGKTHACGLIRRHRLAERLFTDIFEMKDDEVESDACKMEHILSEALTDSVCTFLGHPPTCPHGLPIPKGECCRKYRRDITPVVSRLSDFEVGLEGRIVFIVPSEASRLGRLGSLGIAPGSTIRLLQKMPSFVIKIDETTVALDPEIAKEILVKKVG